MKSSRPFVFVFIVIALGIWGVTIAAQDRESAQGSSDATENSVAPQVFHVMFHSPGPQWKEGVLFHLQTGVDKHIQYMAGLLQQDLVVMGGPFTDNSGGMMVSRISSLEEAQRVASEDPAVKSGLLAVKVRPWMIAMKTVE